METVLVILLLVQLVAFIGIIICIACDYENKLTLNVVPRAETNYKGVQPYLFATKAEAQAKLNKLRGK